MVKRDTLRFVIAGLVAAAVLLLYLPVVGFDFICFDDGMYVYQVDEVAAGFTWPSVKWAFVNNTTGNFHPLTWLSLMADVELFGVDAGVIHLMNAAYHALAAGILFLFLCAFVRRRAAEAASWTVWTAAGFGALLWALHPLRVESVAWVSSRKDVVSVIFCLLGAWAYWRDSLKWWNGRERQTGWSVADPAGWGSLSGWFWCASACFILGYAAKPTMMVFPAFVLLLEWYETGRVRWKPVAGYGGLAALFLVLTMRAQDTAMDFGIPLAVRLENAAVSLSVYLRQQFVPSQLSVFYPYEMPVPGFAVLMGIMSVAYLAYAAFFCWKRCPAVTLAIGWFVAGLVPVIGLIHVGSASRADRYTYLPALGVSLLAAWAVGRYLEAARRSRMIRAVVVAGLVAVCATQAALARDYLAVWENSGTLFAHAARVTHNNAMAHTNAGGYYVRMPEEKDRVTFHYRKALEYERSAKVLGNVALWIMMNMDDAYLDDAGALAAEGMAQPRRPDDYVILDAMGYYLMRKEAYADAEALLRESLAFNKSNPVTWEWLAVCCFKQRKYLAAAAAAGEAATREPANETYRKMVSSALQHAAEAMLPRQRWWQ